MAFPENERETVVLYKLIEERIGWRIIEFQSNAFPDAVLQSDDGKKLKCEFEYLAMNFKKHGHPIDDSCDLIICWKDNWPKSPLPVMALKDYAEKEAKIIQELLGNSVSWYEFVEERTRRIATEKALYEIKNKADAEESINKQQNKWLELYQEWKRAPFFTKQIFALIIAGIVNFFLYLLSTILP